MKVLHIVSSIAQSNGAMNVVMNYYRELAQQGFVFDFLYFHERDTTYLEEIHSLGGSVISCADKSQINIIRNMCAFIEKNVAGYDLIENHELYLTRFIKKGNAKLILHSHTIKYSQRFFASIRNWILCNGIEKKADFLVSCSVASANFFWPKAVKKKQFFIMRNAIPYSKCIFSEESRKKIRDTFFIKEEDILLGYIARFDDGKNQEFLVEVLKRLLVKDKRYKLMLVGAGKNYDVVRNLVDRSSLSSNVIFSGEVAGKDVNEYLSCMDLFLFPSKNEGLGQAVIEAQGNGLQCIVSTGVPNEVKISKGVQFVDLYVNGTLNIDDWVKRIKEMSILRQEIDFFASGYEIGTEAEKVALWYKSATNQMMS